MSGRRIVTLLAGLVAVAATAAGIWAYFAATGSGTGSAVVGSLPAPVVTTADMSGAGEVTLAWSAVTPPDGNADEVTYSVSRDGGTPAGDCSATITLTCTDSGLAADDFFRII